ncbi:MAG: hypothetical protein R3E95_05910 [Thiolinea sp.]
MKHSLLNTLPLLLCTALLPGGCNTPLTEPADPCPEFQPATADTGGRAGPAGGLPPQASDPQARSLIERQGASVITVLTTRNSTMSQCSGGAGAADAIARFQQLAEVRYAEPNGERRY